MLAAVGGGAGGSPSSAVACWQKKCSTADELILHCFALCPRRVARCVWHRHGAGTGRGCSWRAHWVPSLALISTKWTLPELTASIADSTPQGKPCTASRTGDTAGLRLVRRLLQRLLLFPSLSSPTCDVRRRSRAWGTGSTLASSVVAFRAVASLPPSPPSRRRLPHATAFADATCMRLSGPLEDPELLSACPACRIADHLGTCSVCG